MVSIKNFETLVVQSHFSGPIIECSSIDKIHQSHMLQPNTCIRESFLFNDDARAVTKLSALLVREASSEWFLGAIFQKYFYHHKFDWTTKKVYWTTKVHYSLQELIQGDRKFKSHENEFRQRQHRIDKLKVDRILEIAHGNSFLTSGVGILEHFKFAISGIYSTLAGEFLLFHEKFLIERVDDCLN